MRIGHEASVLHLVLPGDDDPLAGLEVATQDSRPSRIRAPGLQGALVSMERDGAVRAMVGGRDYINSIYNRATQAQRQPGSAWKLFVYLAAIEAGHKPDEAIVDEPVTIDGWSQRNDERTYSGQINIRTAFAFSLNTVAAKLGQMVGFQTVADMARRFGITTPINTHPSMVLGTSDVRLIDMTRAFAEIDNKGAAVIPYAITKVVGNKATILFDSGVRSGQDVMRALALGAQAAFAGKSFLWAIAALGEDGPAQLIDLYMNDLRASLGQIGAQSPAEARLATVVHRTRIDF